MHVIYFYFFGNYGVRPYWPTNPRGLNTMTQEVGLGKCMLLVHMQLQSKIYGTLAYFLCF